MVLRACVKVNLPWQKQPVSIWVITSIISSQIQSGRFGNASKVVRASLRLLENEEQKLETLRQALIAGENSGDAGELDMEKIRRNAKKKAKLAR